MKNELVFPKKIPGTNIGEFSTSPTYTNGLTKREYFAGLAMQGISATLANKDAVEAYLKIYKKEGLNTEDVIAAASVKFADALLNELQKKGE